MFGEKRIRLYIAIAWLVCFVSMWLIFNALLPTHQFKTYLTQIDKSVANKDWPAAKKSMAELNRIYSSKRAVIQTSNATEIFTSFELTMGQLEASIENEQESAIEYVGGLKSSLDFVMKAFSGP